MSFSVQRTALIVFKVNVGKKLSFFLKCLCSNINGIFNVLITKNNENPC